MFVCLPVWFVTILTCGSVVLCVQISVLVVSSQSVGFEVALFVQVGSPRLIILRSILRMQCCSKFRSILYNKILTNWKPSRIIYVEVYTHSLLPLKVAFDTRHLQNEKGFLQVVSELENISSPFVVTFHGMVLPPSDHRVI